jgi:predicted transcriptional regulator
MKSTEFAADKLSILYFLKILDMPLANNQITEFFAGNNILNYFEMQHLLAELIETEHIIQDECRNNQYYVLSEKGNEALALFSSRIDAGVREMMDEFAARNRERLKNESELLADYTKIDDNNYEVSLKVMEQERILLHIKLNVINIRQAKAICSNWKSKAPQVYRKIIELLVEQK